MDKRTNIKYPGLYRTDRLFSSLEKDFWEEEEMAKLFLS
jgi:hypothetical protein